MARLNHKFHIITDRCTICGVYRKTVNHVGSGFDPTLFGYSHKEYSTDGIHWSKEFINCLPKTKKK